jgi:hypothetical protein
MATTKAFNQSIKPMPHLKISPVCLPRHPAVAYLFLVGQQPNK